MPICKPFLMSMACRVTVCVGGQSTGVTWDLSTILYLNETIQCITLGAPFGWWPNVTFQFPPSKGHKYSHSCSILKGPMWVNVTLDFNNFELKLKVRTFHCIHCLISKNVVEQRACKTKCLYPRTSRRPCTGTLEQVYSTTFLEGSDLNIGEVSKVGLLASCPDVWPVKFGI